MTTKLMALKIPSTWAVIYNSFGDEDPVVRNGSIANDEYYKEDLLSIERLWFNGSDWSTEPNGYVLDLGWYPEADPQGSYCLTLLRGDWDHTLVKYESRDRRQIRAAIERCLDLLTQGVADQDMTRLMEAEELG